MYGLLDGEGVDTIVLGGNITLEGFGALDHPSLVVVKAVVGRSIAHARSAAPGLSGLRVRLVVREGRYCCDALGFIDGRKASGGGVAGNLCVALDESHKHVREGLEASLCSI
jgi:hypothetical protein